MMNFKKIRKEIWMMTVLAIVLIMSAITKASTDANNTGDPNAVRTTKDFSTPMPFGTAGDGAIFPGKPYAGREVVEVRIYWDIVVAEGYDAADIIANVHLPIIMPSGHLAEIDLNASTLGWSGSGTFNYSEVTDRYNHTFGPVWTRYDWWATGLPFEVVEVLPSSRIEIDYLAPCDYNLVGDVNKDCKVDLIDFALLAGSWLSDCILMPDDPACIPK